MLRCFKTDHDDVNTPNVLVHHTQSYLSHLMLNKLLSQIGDETAYYIINRLFQYQQMHSSSIMFFTSH
jgi:hypothetical protein